jgi:hypothetical protein
VSAARPDPARAKGGPLTIFSENKPNNSGGLFMANTLARASCLYGEHAPACFAGEGGGWIREEQVDVEAWGADHKM